MIRSLKPAVELIYNQGKQVSSEAWATKSPDDQ
jgi:hypothetical protein